MEEGGKGKDVVNEMFSWDSCSFSLWGAEDGGGRMEVSATDHAAEEDKGDEGERKKRKQSEDLRKGVIAGGGDEENSNDKDNEAEERIPEVHTQTERERRKRMRDMFTTLQVLDPHLTTKTDKSTIVEETIKYIRSLEQSLQILQDKKREKVINQSKNVIACHSCRSDYHRLLTLCTFMAANRKCLVQF